MLDNPVRWNVYVAQLYNDVPQAMGSQCSMNYVLSRIISNDVCTSQS